MVYRDYLSRKLKNQIVYQYYLFSSRLSRLINRMKPFEKKNMVQKKIKKNDNDKNVYKLYVLPKFALSIYPINRNP